MEEERLLSSSNNSERKMAIPSWNEINNGYEQRWLEEKEKFQNTLKVNFFL